MKNKMNKFRVEGHEGDGVMVVANTYQDVIVGMGVLNAEVHSSGYRWCKYKIPSPMMHSFASGIALRFNSYVLIEDMGLIDVYPSYAQTVTVEDAHEKDPNLSDYGDHL